MKVKELIKLLKECNLRAEVKFEGIDHKIYPIETVLPWKILQMPNEWVIITPFEYNAIK